MVTYQNNIMAQVFQNPLKENPLVLFSIIGTWRGAMSFLAGIFVEKWCLILQKEG